MSQFRPLIEKQQLKIDNHMRGTGAPHTWGSGLHIHKRFNIASSRAGIEILMPLDRDTPVEVRGIKNRNDKRWAQIEKEIKKALKANDTRRLFATDLHTAIDEFLAQDLEIDELRRASRRIAKHFDLSDKIESEIVEIHRKAVKTYVGLHPDTKSYDFYEIKQTKGRISIKKSDFRHSSYLRHNLH